MKPTPAQARLLRYLNEPVRDDRYPHTINLYYWRGKLQADCFGYSHKAKLAATAQSLLKNFWIIPLEPTPMITPRDAKRIAESTTMSSKNIEYKISPEGKAALAGLSESDFISPTSKKPIHSANDITKALFDYYRQKNKTGYASAPAWICFSELRKGTVHSKSRVDFWAMSCWESNNFDRISYEIKISRGDYLNELKQPQKRDFALAISNYFYFVTPPGLISVDELPPECGLIELSESGKLRTIKKAPRRNPQFAFSWSFMAALGRNIYLQSPHV